MKKAKYAKLRVLFLLKDPKKDGLALLFFRRASLTVHYVGYQIIFFSCGCENEKCVANMNNIPFLVSAKLNCWTSNVLLSGPPVVPFFCPYTVAFVMKRLPTAGTRVRGPAIETESAAPSDAGEIKTLAEVEVTTSGATGAAMVVTLGDVPAVALAPPETGAIRAPDLVAAPGDVDPRRQDTLHAPAVYATPAPVDAQVGPGLTRPGHAVGHAKTDLLAAIDSAAESNGGAEVFPTLTPAGRLPWYVPGGMAVVVGDLRAATPQMPVTARAVDDIPTRRGSPAPVAPGLGLEMPAFPFPGAVAVRDLPLDHDGLAVAADTRPPPSSPVGLGPQVDAFAPEAGTGTPSRPNIPRLLATEDEEVIPRRRPYDSVEEDRPRAAVGARAAGVPQTDGLVVYGLPVLGDILPALTVVEGPTRPDGPDAEQVEEVGMVDAFGLVFPVVLVQAERPVLTKGVRNGPPDEGTFRPPPGLLDGRPRPLVRLGARAAFLGCLVVFLREVGLARPVGPRLQAPDGVVPTKGGPRDVAPPAKAIPAPVRLGAVTYSPVVRVGAVLGLDGLPANAGVEVQATVAPGIVPVPDAAPRPAVRVVPRTVEVVAIGRDVVLAVDMATTAPADGLGVRPRLVRDGRLGVRLVAPDTDIAP